MIDNYDSFVDNLIRYFKELNQEIIAYKNDELTIADIIKLQPEGIIISPGPKTPKQAGNSLEIITYFKGKMPILGVCLGHQAIADVFGGQIIHGTSPMHGKVSPLFHDRKGLFLGLEQGLLGTRYHSLIVEKESLPECLEITCQTQEGEIMGIRHKEYPIEGVQFHPEAELSEYGHAMLQNFVDLCKREQNL